MSINVLPKWHSGKESTCQYRRHERHGFSSLVGKIPWSRKWQHTPMFLSGVSHGHRSLQATVHGIAKRDTPERLNKLGRSRSAWATYGTCEGILRPGGLEAWRMGPTRCGHRGLHLYVTPAAGCVLLGLAQAERALSLAAAELWPGPCAGLFPSSASRKP